MFRYVLEYVVLMIAFLTIFWIILEWRSSSQTWEDQQNVY